MNGRQDARAGKPVESWSRNMIAAPAFSVSGRITGSRPSPPGDYSLVLHLNYQYPIGFFPKEEV
jgi:hypothetical protein